jgi:hypothetical protein
MLQKQISHNFDAIYNTMGGKNVTIHLQIQELTYGMHKIVRRCNLEEEEEEGLDKKKGDFCFGNSNS